ncbi:TVP38/TMEM64 family protein [Bradyrhizobium sp. SYSU BS000235]|uniref:TVP38/TMEM64 family protein n=1 Tax=Bradyrhizobium sp. SYSU BS000235 TaxID=3411332 RepID=UPI003C70CE4B
MQVEGVSRFVKAFVIVLLIASGSWLARESGLSLSGLQELLEGNVFAPVIFVGLQVACSLLFLPRAIMAVTAGLVFGFWTGLVWASIGSAVGALAGFVLTRYFVSDLVKPSEWSRFGSVVRRVEQGGWRAVAMLRLVPAIPHSLTNYLLGLTSLRTVDFALGSVIGQLPMTIAFVQFGAAGARLATGNLEWVQPTLIGVVMLVLSLLPQLWRRIAQRQLPTPIE